MIFLEKYYKQSRDLIIHQLKPYRVLHLLKGLMYCEIQHTYIECVLPQFRELW